MNQLFTIWILDNNNFEIFQLYTFLVGFISFLFLLYIIYNLSRVKSKTQYLGSLILDPFFHAVIVIVLSVFVVNQFGKQKEKNTFLDPNLCKVHLETALNNGIEFVQSGQGIISFEQAYLNVINENSCWFQKNQFKNEWKKTIRQLNEQTSIQEKRASYLLLITDLLNNRYKRVLKGFEDPVYQNFDTYEYYFSLANHKFGNYHEPFPLLKAAYAKPGKHPNLDHIFAESLYKNIGPTAFTGEYKDENLFQNLPFQKKIIVDLLNNDFSKIFSHFNKPQFNKTALFNLFIALLILFSWTYYIRAIDLFDREKWSQMFVALVLCILTIQVVYFIFYGLFDYYIAPMHFYAEFPLWLKYIINIGVIEELVKIIPVFIILRFTKFIDEPYDFLVYAALSGIAFAFMQSSTHYADYRTGVFFESGFYASLFQLSLTAIAVSSIIFSYTGNKKITKFSSIFFFFIIAAVLHGLYDYLTIEKPFLYLFFSVVIFFFVLYFWQILANNALNYSPHFTYQKKFNLGSYRYLFIILLCIIWMAEYLFIGLNENVNAANNFLTLNFVFSLLILFFAATSLFNFDYVRNYWRGFTFYSNDDEFSTYRSGAFALIDLISPKIILAGKSAHNYVGIRAEFKPVDLSINLSEKFGDISSGEIVDRKIIVPNVKSSVASKGDPYWFVLKLDEPVDLGAENSDYFLIRFQDTDPIFENSNSQAAKLFFRDDLHWLEEEVISKKDLTALGWIDIERTK